MAKKDISILNEKIKLHKNGIITLIHLDAEKYHQSRLELLKIQAKQFKCPGLYLSLNLPAKAILAELNDNKIDMSKLVVVDGINKDTGMLQGLVEMSIKITTLLNTGKYKFMIIDSASTLLISNNTETTERFILFIINKARFLNISLFIMFIHDEKSHIVSDFLSQSSDKYIKL